MGSCWMGRGQVAMPLTGHEEGSGHSALSAAAAHYATGHRVACSTEMILQL